MTFYQSNRPFRQLSYLMAVVLFIGRAAAQQTGTPSDTGTNQPPKIDAQPTVPQGSIHPEVSLEDSLPIVDDSSTKKQSSVAPSSNNILTPSKSTTLVPAQPVVPSNDDSEPRKEETPDDIFNDLCSTTALVKDFCDLPPDLKAFLHPNVTLRDIGRFLLSDVILANLKTHCPPGTWCLDSAFSADLDQVEEFWTNSEDFSKLCWPDFGLCLDYMSDFYFNCDMFETFHLITSMTSLLCEMKKEPKASSDCIRQTIKLLHISFADSTRTIEELSSSENAPVCDTRKSKMTYNFLCTTDICEKYSAVLYEFEPWVWLTDGIEQTKKQCSLDDQDCEAIAAQDRLTYLIEEYEKNYALQLNLPAVIVIVVVSVAAVGAVSLVLVVFLRKRHMRVRVRDGMQYLEIKPEETEAFLECDELGDNTKLINQ